MSPGVQHDQTGAVMNNPRVRTIAHLRQVSSVARRRLTYLSAECRRWIYSLALRNTSIQAGDVGDDFR